MTSKMFFLKSLGFLGLTYAVVGILLHSLYKLNLMEHYCEPLLFGFDDSHLSLFTIAAGITATLFAILKRKKSS